MDTTTPRFERRLRIRFSHCDPAGIVFYPQYFVLFVGLIEDWVTEGLGISYAELLGARRVGLPTVNMQCDFKAICRMGDEVSLGLQLQHVGRTSLSLLLDCRRGEQLCVSATNTLVCTDLKTHRSIPLPDDLRAALLSLCSLNGDQKMNTLLPPGWPRPRGYANGVVASGRTIFVAGMVGWDAQGHFQSDDFAAQAHQTLANIVAVLKVGGAQPHHIVRMTWYVLDKHEYLAALPSIGRAFRELVGHYDIAMTAVQVSALIEDRARVEIEVTAVVPD